MLSAEDGGDHRAMKKIIEIQDFSCVRVPEQHNASQFWVIWIIFVELWVQSDGCSRAIPLRGRTGVDDAYLHARTAVLSELPERRATAWTRLGGSNRLPVPLIIRCIT